MGSEESSDPGRDEDEPVVEIGKKLINITPFTGSDRNQAPGVCARPPSTLRNESEPTPSPSNARTLSPSNARTLSPSNTRTLSPSNVRTLSPLNARTLMTLMSASTETQLGLLHQHPESLRFPQALAAPKPDQPEPRQQMLRASCIKLRFESLSLSLFADSNSLTRSNGRPLPVKDPQGVTRMNPLRSKF